MKIKMKIRALIKYLKIRLMIRYFIEIPILFLSVNVPSYFNFITKPLYKHKFSTNLNIDVKTDYPVAFDSPDHLHPHGTKRDNSKRHKFNKAFFQVAKLRYYRKPYRILDLGCAGGGMVKTFIGDGHVAVGLEGSDYNKKRKRFEWRIIPNNLFTCDISRPFQINLDNKPMQFNMITCWEVLEHMKEERLPTVFDNIKRHLNDDGIFVCSISHYENSPDGVILHQTVHLIDWWDEQFASFGFKRLVDIENLFENKYVRRLKMSDNRVYGLKK